MKIKLIPNTIIAYKDFYKKFSLLLELKHGSKSVQTSYLIKKLEINRNINK